MVSEIVPSGAVASALREPKERLRLVGVHIGVQGLEFCHASDPLPHVDTVVTSEERIAYESSAQRTREP